MLMNRNLLYTAVTRARKCVTLVGDEKVFAEIKQAGPLGNYLSGRTPKEYRQEHWLTKLFNRQAGNPQPIFDEIGDLRERASKEVEERVAGYTLPDLTKTQKDILNRYLPEDEKF